MAARSSCRPVFQMAVWHEYTGTVPYTAFTLAPLGETEKTMERFGLLAGQTDNILTIYAEPARLAALGGDLRKQFASLELAFTIQFTDPSFGQFTDWPWQDGSALVFFEHSAGRNLTAKATVSDQDFLPVRSGSFSYELPGRPGPAPARLVKLGGAPVAELPPPIKGKVQVDLSQAPAGCYGIQLSEKAIFSFFCPRSISLLPFSAVIRIACAAMLKAPTLAAGKTSRQVSQSSPHQLTLASRATAWRYDIFNHGGIDPARFSIAELPSASAGAARNPHPVQRRFFTPVQGTTAPSGETSIAFESPLDRPIPFRAKPPLQFQLLRDGRVIVEQLPTPDLSFRRASDGKNLVSDIFVYL